MMKWYEQRRPDGTCEWWTQRDGNGNAFLVRETGSDKKLKLFINGVAGVVPGSFDSLDEAFAAAERVYEPRIKWTFGVCRGLYPEAANALCEALWFDDYETAAAYREKMIMSGEYVTEIAEREVV